MEVEWGVWGAVQNAGARELNVHDDNAWQYQTVWTLETSVLVQGPLAQSCRCQLIHFREYCMRQGTTAVNQCPISPIFNMTNNALDRFDVNGV
jgi:hypothetical protein